MIYTITVSWFATDPDSGYWVPHQTGDAEHSTGVEVFAELLSGRSPGFVQEVFDALIGCADQEPDWGIGMDGLAIEKGKDERFEVRHDYLDEELVRVSRSQLLEVLQWRLAHFNNGVAEDPSARIEDIQVDLEICETFPT